MRLILRHQNKQSKIEGKQPFCDDATEDYAVVVDGPQVGRIYRQLGSQMASAEWRWVVQTVPTASGYAATLDEAKAAFAKAFKPDDS